MHCGLSIFGWYIETYISGHIFFQIRAIILFRVGDVLDLSKIRILLIVAAKLNSEFIDEKESRIQPTVQLSGRCYKWPQFRKLVIIHQTFNIIKYVANWFYCLAILNFPAISRPNEILDANQYWLSLDQKVLQTKQQFLEFLTFLNFPGFFVISVFPDLSSKEIKINVAADTALFWRLPKNRFRDVVRKIPINYNILASEIVVLGRARLLFYAAKFKTV